MDATLLFNQLLDEIRIDEAALQEKKDLVRLLKKRLENGRAGGAVFGVPTAIAQPPTLVQMVEHALPDLAQREFVVSDVAAVMKTKGFALPDKPNGRITTVLSRMQATGDLERTFTGGGNVPHRYKRVTVVALANPALKEAPVSAT